MRCELDGDGPRVLVADDDDNFARATWTMLEAAGFTVVGRATNGVEAVRLAERLRPDVVTMDLDMPLMDGVDATRRVVALGIPVVALTGSDSGLRVTAVRAAGAAAALAKPDAANALGEVLRSVIA